MADPASSDLDATRAAVVERNLVAAASAALTGVASTLPFEDLGAFKTLLKRFFSAGPWTTDDAAALDALVTPHLHVGWWQEDLDDEITLSHGIRDGRYVLRVTGVGDRPVPPGLFDRVFSGPVTPEATPHPRKVKFNLGGVPAPGRWYRRSDPDPPDEPGVSALFSDPEIGDVMVAGDFVTIGLVRGASWEDRLDDIVATVTELFPTGSTDGTAPRTRDDLLDEGRRGGAGTLRHELHLLDPDDLGSRRRLTDALDAPDARTRRVAVAVLAESADDEVAHGALRRGYADVSRLVSRTAIDTAADAGDERLRDLFEEALADADPWTRWKAVRSLGELGVGPSRRALERLDADPDFQVRFEVARVLRI